MSNKQLRGIDLFAGAGGMSLGFSNAGFDMLAGIEIDKHSSETLQKNHKNMRVITDDICSVDAELLLSDLNLNPGELDVIIGGPPCQGFSHSNRRTRNLENPLNQLYKEFIRFVKVIKPQCFVMENVYGMKTFNSGSIVKIIEDEFKKHGYKVQSKILNSADYGVPQNRRRIFIIGHNNGRDIKFPEPKTKKITVRDAIGDLPVLENGNNIDEIKYLKFGDELTDYQKIMREDSSRKKVKNNWVTRNSNLVFERYKHIPQGGNWSDIPELLMNNYKDKNGCHSGIYRRLKWDEVCIPISNFRKNMLVHPEQHRGLSVREAARIQSFPDHYIFYGPINPQQQQVANAVPPLLAEEICKNIIKYLMEVN